MNQVRTFLAADLDAAFLDASAALAERLRGGALSKARASWVARHAMHVTLRFYGEGSPPRGALVHPGGGPPVVRARGLDAFPRTAKARVLFVALEDDGWLAGIARAAERIAVEAGFAPEPRAFTPHLTLARFKEPIDVRAICAEPLVLPEAHITGITLYESKTLPSGPIYTALARLDIIEG